MGTVTRCKEALQPRKRSANRQLGNSPQPLRSLKGAVLSLPNAVLFGNAVFENLHDKFASTFKHRRLLQRYKATLYNYTVQMNTLQPNSFVWYVTTNLTFMEPCIARYVFYITNEMQIIQCSLLLSAPYMFRPVFPPIIRSL